MFTFVFFAKVLNEVIVLYYITHVTLIRPFPLSWILGGSAKHRAPRLWNYNPAVDSQTPNQELHQKDRQKESQKKMFLR